MFIYAILLKMLSAIIALVLLMIILSVAYVVLISPLLSIIDDTAHDIMRIPERVRMMAAKSNIDRLVDVVDVFDEDGNFTPEYEALNGYERDYMFRAWSKKMADEVIHNAPYMSIDLPAAELVDIRNYYSSAYLTYDDERLRELASEAEALVMERARMSAVTKKQVKANENAARALLASVAVAPVITVGTMLSTKRRR